MKCNPQLAKPLMCIKVGQWAQLFKIKLNLYTLISNHIVSVKMDTHCDIGVQHCRAGF